MIAEKDIDVFFQEFAQEVVYNEETTIRAILDMDFVLAVNEQGFAGIEAYDLMATVKSKDIPNVKHDDTITVNHGRDNEKTYYVKEIRHTGSGTTMLFLSEVM